MSDEIRGTVGHDGKHNAIGKDLQQVNIYQDTLTWRELVRRDLESIERRILILMIAIVFLSLLLAGGMVGAIRQFDWTYLQIERLEQRLERQIVPPIPIVPLP